MKVFKNSVTSPLDSIIDRQHNILTNPEVIATEIHVHQSNGNRHTVPTCQHQTTHSQYFTWSVQQHLWDDLDDFTIDQQGEPQISLHAYFDT